MERAYLRYFMTLNSKKLAFLVTIALLLEDRADQFGRSFVFERKEQKGEQFQNAREKVQRNDGLITLAPNS